MFEMLIYIMILVCSVITVFITCVLLARKYHSAKKNVLKKASTAIVLGSGGHTTEMLKLVSNLDKEKFTPRIYFAANTDEFSVKKVVEFEQGCQDYEVYVVPRAREVGQSYLTSVFTSLSAFIGCLRPVYNLTADVLLVNGPGTCLPISCLYMVLHPAGKTIYVESICRVKTLSLCCRLLKKFVTVTLVQWPEVEAKFGDTSYIGKLV